jgi:hypothetical protein
MTQNNLGAALQTLAERESGTARLEEAVAAYQAALEILEPSQATYYVGGTQRNLARAEAELASRCSVGPAEKPRTARPPRGNSF